MDSFFGIGFPELIMILLLAGLVMGPQRIRVVARTLGRLVAQVQALSRQFTTQLNAELDSLDQEEVRGAMDDMKELRRQLADLQRQVRSLPSDLAGEGKRAVQEGQKVLREVPPPPPPKRDVKTEPDGAEEPAPATESLPRPLDVADDPEP